MENTETHELVTIDDVCNLITEENIESFTTDLLHFLYFHLKLKSKISKEDYLALKKTLIWKNDGIEGVTHIKVNGQLKKLENEN